MEEDIKVLEDLINYWKDLIKMTEKDSSAYKWIKIEDKEIEKPMKALENLIKRNKELEDKVKTLKSLSNDYNRLWIEKCEEYNSLEIGKNYIPKSKVREKKGIKYGRL